MFKIEDIHFDIEYAILDAFVDDEDMTLNWGVEVAGVRKDVGGQSLKPKAQSEILFKTRPEELTHWTDIAGKEISWEEGLDEEEEPYGTLYLFEHEPVYDSTILLGKGLNKNEIRIEWKGKCDLHWTEKDNVGQSFEIAANLAFKGIWFGRDPEPKSLAVLENFFSKEDFEFTVEDGASLFSPKRDKR